VRPHRFGRPQAGDQIYVITTPDYVSILDKLFAGPGEGVDNPDLYGEFAIDPEAHLADIARLYPAVIPRDDESLTAKDFLRRQLAGDIEPGDRVPLGPVDLIVRRVNEAHEIEEVGLAMEHAEGTAAADSDLPEPKGDRRPRARLGWKAAGAVAAWNVEIQAPASPRVRHRATASAGAWRARLAR
jgi:NhaP-type Na+/H+ and K+/H+ antiporter